MLDSLLIRSARISRAAAWAGGAAMMVAAFIVSFDVLARKLFNWSMQGSDELSGYIFAISTAWAFSYALLERANVRIDGVYLLAPTSLKAAMDVIGLVALAAYVGALLHGGWVLWLDSYEYGSHAITPWRTPLAVPQGLWMIGWIWLAVCLGLLLLRLLQSLVRGDLAGVVAVAGVRTMQEEVAAEVAHAKEELEHERRLHAAHKGS